MQTYTRNTLVVLLLVILFAIAGYWVGTPSSAGGATFGVLLAAYTTDRKTQVILLLIIIDIITGVISALHHRVLQPKILPHFYITNVIPYVFGFFLVWCIVLTGLDNLLAQVYREVIVAILFSTIITALCASITDNVLELRKPVQVQ